VPGRFRSFLAPTNADFPELEILFVGGFDEESTSFGAEGRGELTAVPVTRGCHCRVSRDRQESARSVDDD